MSTKIPPTVLSEILGSKSSVETIVASLNETEEKCSSSRRHWNAKRVYPFWKACQRCSKPFQAHNRTQAIRNKTCGPECVRATIASARSGARPPETQSGKVQLTCSVCGEDFFRNRKHAERVNIATCSRRCNGTLRGRALVAHAHKGRANWGQDAVKAFRQRMTGPANPSWKGGLTYRNRKGAYANQPIKYVRCPPGFLSMARKDGYVMEHRLMVATAMGRVLTRAETVHHVNHDATDNRLENLILFATNGQHKAFEHGAAIEPLWCGLCRSTTSAKSGVCACRPAPLLPSATA